MSLLERIKELREQNGNLSINKLEKEAGLSRGSMAKWDDHAPSYDKLKKVADYFNVSPHYLLTGEAEQQKKPTPGDEDGMSEAEKGLVKLFRQIPEEKQSQVLESLELALRMQGLL